MSKTVCIFKAKIPEVPAWDPDSIHTGVTGSEECVIYSAEALKNLGFKVVVLNNITNPDQFSNPSANPCYAGYLRKEDFFDVTILHDELQLAPILRPRTKKLYFLAHNHCKRNFENKEIDAFDDILWLSSHQRTQWSSINSRLSKFTKIFGNAVNPQTFKPIQQRTNPYSCIYTSDYGRGLYILLMIWEYIKTRFPLATLDIYYGLRNWGNMPKEDEQFLRENIQRLKPLGVTDHGMVGHEELAEAFSKASLWTYPCTYPETFCITAIKAQLAGAIPVIIQRDALYETVRFGFKCNRIEDYRNLLIQAMSQIETVSLDERKKMGSFVLEEFTWEKITSRWAELF